MTEEVKEKLECAVVRSKSYEHEISTMIEQPTKQFQVILRVRRGITANSKEAKMNAKEKVVTSDVLEVLVPNKFKKAANKGMIKLMAN